MSDELYGLVEPFDTEGLDVPPETAFALGVEWAMFRRKLQRAEKSGRGFSAMVMTLNAERLAALCRRHGRAVAIRWLHDDYEQWRVLDVASAA